MKTRHLSLRLLCLFLATSMWAEQFTIFPDRTELRSPDGRFVIRSVDQAAGRSDFTGVFRSLVLEEVSSGQSRKLYDYAGRVAVAWSGNKFIIVTDYVNKRTARAVVIASDPGGDAVVLDKVRLARLLPSELSPHLLRNDHVYVEVVRVDSVVLTLRVWGFGANDTGGFRWDCRYDLNETTASCGESVGGGPRP